MKVWAAIFGSLLLAGCFSFQIKGSPSQAVIVAAPMPAVATTASQPPRPRAPVVRRAPAVQAPAKAKPKPTVFSAVPKPVNTIVFNPALPMQRPFVQIPLSNTQPIVYDASEFRIYHEHKWNVLGLFLAFGAVFLFFGGVAVRSYLSKRRYGRI